MTAPRPAPQEPVPAKSERTGFAAFEPLAPALQLVAEWAPDPVAVIAAGSHASGGAVWVECDGRRWTLSDLDLYVVVRDRRTQALALSRWRSGRPSLAAQRHALGLAAPLETAFLTRADLRALPARPGTIELARHGRVVAGDPAVLDDVPRREGRHVSPEEVLLLLENRAFELLLARERLRDPVLLTRLAARHAVLRTALDLATVRALALGHYPDGAAARVALARTARGAEALEPAWAEALGWRDGSRPVGEAAEPLAEWGVVARAWDAEHRARTRRGVLRAAARAPFRRRVREAFQFASRTGEGPPLGERLRHLAAGTPRHRVHASGAAVLRGLVATGAPDRMPAAVREELARLGVVPDSARGSLAAASRAASRAWDRWLLDGQRTEDPA